jgi:hypothetical protein
LKNKITDEGKHFHKKKLIFTNVMQCNKSPKN